MPVLLDASNAWYRSYVATTLSPPGGPVLIMTYMLRRLCQQHGMNNIIVCWDGGSEERKKLDPNYKAQRSPRQGVWEDIRYMKEMVDCLGIAHCHKTGCEADDVIGSLATNYDDVLIHSFDKDFYQLVNEKIKVFRPERKINGKVFPPQIIGHQEVVEEFNCPPDKVVLVKAFQGDSSDNIEKISIRFTKNFAEKFFQVVQKSSNVENFYKHLLDFDKKYHEALLSFKDRALLNERLITINTGLDVAITQNKQDLHKFSALCENLEITKLKATDWEEMPTTKEELPPIQNSLF